MKSIVEQIFWFGHAQPKKIALCNGSQELTYDELVRGIIFAKELLETRYCIKKGDRVILAADKQVEFVVTYFACHLIEAVVIPIAPDTNTNRYALIKKKAAPNLVVGFQDESVVIKSTDFEEFKGMHDSYNMNQVSYPDPESVADIIFTTGTTGEPKGVQLTHKNISAAARNINTFIRNSSSDNEMLVLPISHSFGLGRMRCALSNGQTLVILGSFVNVKKFFRLMKKYQVNGFGMVPANWGLLKRFSGETIGEYRDQLHYIEIGSAAMPIEDKKLLMKLLPNTRICMHYGSTEASRSAFLEFHEESNHLETVGRPSPNMDIIICDDSGCQVPAGIEGEICVSGDAVTSGYLNSAREGSFWGNFFRTGDWGIQNQDGYIILKSRKKDLINVGGKKVSPIEVEDVLQSFEFVDDCACIGIADSDGILGEVVKAYIVSSQVAKVSYDYIDKLIGKRLERYKHPVIYEMIDEIPRTSSGKVQRVLLK